MGTRTGEDPVLTAEDLATRHQVKLQTVYAWNHKGTGPRYFRVGRLPRYYLSDVIDWERSNYATSGGDEAA